MGSVVVVVVSPVLDDEAAQLAALDNPVAYLSGLQAPVVVDEVQPGGDPAVRAVKRHVDDSDEPGRFLLTGSTNILSVPAKSESFAGRARILRLFPFTQAEIHGRAAIDLVGCFDNCEIDAPQETEDPAHYMDRLCRAGFLEAVSLTPAQRQDWYSSYLETAIQRDVTELGDIPEPRPSSIWCDGWRPTPLPSSTPRRPADSSAPTDPRSTTTSHGSTRYT